jgi:hypothetical protein
MKLRALVILSPKTIVIFLIFFFLTGCAGYTQHIFRGTTYEQAWQACMKVREQYKPTDVEVRKFGVKVFDTKADKDQGVISFATDETWVVSHVENTVLLKEINPDDVRLSIRSVDRTYFLPWAGRKIEDEKLILKEIQEALKK